MNTREEIIAYGLSFPDTYQNAPFRDPNWQLVRVRNTKKAFLWTYEKDGLLHIYCLLYTSPSPRDRG